MSMIQSDLLLGQEGGAGYVVERSLRFNSSDSAYLSRTPASAGNRKTFTFSCWIKRSKAGDFRTIFSAATNTSNLFIIRFTDADLLEIRSATSGSTVFQLVTTQVFRDFSAWYHIVVAVDTTNATGGDRVRLYINGSEVTVFNTDTVPTQNADSWVNNNVLHEICRQANNPSNYYQDGYLADVHLIDGQQLTPSSFAETNATTGQWVPKAYTGSYGTNGFQLKFADNSNNTATTLGKDTSGNSNNWTPNNLSVTAGAGNDSLVDTPTSYGTDTGAGGEVRGNYATLSPLDQNGVTLSNGNLNIKAQDKTAAATIIPSSGKYYWEVTLISGFVGGAGTYFGAFGVAPVRSLLPSLQSSSGFSGVACYTDVNGGIYNNGSGVFSSSTFTSNDIIGIAFDASTLSLSIYRNGVQVGSTLTVPTGSTKPVFLLNGTGGVSGEAFVNFGQRQWTYAAPAGFKALCDTNLPAPVVAKPSSAFDVKLYTGNGSTQTISGLGFSPDLVWIKRRDTASTQDWFDTVRGASKVVYSNLANAEETYSGVTAFNSDGFTVGSALSSNGSGGSLVAWCFDAGANTVSNTQGSITSTVRANPSAGFSIVTYTGNSSAGATVGHGLGVTPELIIVKRRDGGNNWQVRHTSITPANSIQLNLTNAAAAATTVWNSTAPTSTVFTIGTSNDVNTNNPSPATYVAYCFAPVAGYSSFGSYTGNGSADGPMVFCGFRPRFILVKCSSAGSTNWWIFDSARTGYNASNLGLYPDLSAAESTGSFFDILSNGFKVRSADANFNTSSGTYVFACFAEAPFSLARAR